MEIRSKLQKVKSACIILGMLIYFTRLIREDLQGHETILYWLGFIPNFGMSFAFPFIFFAKGHIFYHTYRINFYIGCIIVFVIMILNEIVDKYQPRRVFDWMDIWASFVGILCAAFVYYFVLRNEESEI